MQDLKDIILNKKQYSDVKERIHATDLLIVDECSMMSKRLFECLNAVCQLKNPDIIFGGIQIVLVGDFKQLPPVPNTLYADDGEYCFSSDIFDTVFAHKIELKQVVRQHEGILIQAISECSTGNINMDTRNFIKNLSRPLPEKPNTETTMLFSTNDLVDDYNRKRLLELPGQLYEFLSKDSGEKRFIEKITVPKVLWLKKGAPVILMRNLTDKLVNGLKGHVVGIGENGPVVKFGEDELPISKMKCSGKRHLSC